MEIYQLRYFATVAEMGSFTKAALKCNISQPSLSQQIINLETELNQKLFHRLGRKISLTPAGQMLLERSRRILMEVDNALKELGDDKTAKHRVTVGAIPTLAPYLMPKIIARCRMNYPNLLVSTYEDFIPYLVESVAEGEIDLALASLPVIDRRVIVEPLFKEPLLLVLSYEHRLADQKIITANDLIEESFIMLGTSSSVAAQIRSFCGDNHFEPHVVHGCSQIKTLKMLVGLNLGIAIMPAGTMSPEDELTLLYRELSGPGAPTREVALIRHPRRFVSRGTEQFMATVRDTLARAPIPMLPATAPLLNSPQG